MTLGAADLIAAGLDEDVAGVALAEGDVAAGPAPVDIADAPAVPAGEVPAAGGGGGAVGAVSPDVR